jgi:hypothetical protein
MLSIDTFIPARAFAPSFKVSGLGIELIEIIPDFRRKLTFLVTVEGLTPRI